MYRLVSSIFQAKRSITVSHQRCARGRRQNKNKSIDDFSFFFSFFAASTSHAMFQLSDVNTTIAVAIIFPGGKSAGC